MSRVVAVRIAGLSLVLLLVASAVLTYLAYTAAFTPTAKITVTSERAGLVLDREAKVKYRGLRVGTVKDITYADDRAKLTLAIESGQLPYIPSNADVLIGGTTIFGAKSVEFLPPKQPSSTSLQPGAHVQASRVQLEVNTLFQSLVDLLNKIDPVLLSGTLSALAEGLQGNGEDVGELLAGTNLLAERLIPMMPTLQKDFQQVADVANVYADAGPDLVTVIENVPAISETVVDQQENLNATLLAATGLGNSAYDTIAPAEDDYIAAIQRLRAPLTVLGDYSPMLPCLLQGVRKAGQEFSPVIGGTRPGLFVSSNFVPGVPAYTYPESLPIVNASGGPNCRGLPNMPTKQFGGTWYKSKFLVTDNAYIPYEPFTEMQVDATSTLQFLFNGAFAERDDF